MWYFEKVNNNIFDKKKKEEYEFDIIGIKFFIFN